jgi:hypothetical protein
MMAIAALALLGASSAWADTLSFDLTTPNAAMTPYPSPYATVFIDRIDAFTANVTFTGGTPTGYAYLFGDGSSVALNVNASSFSVDTIAGSNPYPNFSTAAFNVVNPPGTSNINGFGSFNMVIDSGKLNNGNFSNGGFKETSQVITFTLHNLDSGTGWTSVSQVLIANTGGSTAAAHPFVCQNDSTVPCDEKNGALATGFVANGSEVPEPRIISLLAALGGLLAMVGIYRRRQSAN